jgi:hypothetical protein
MNQVFNFKRWLLYTGKHWAENRKRYLLGLVAITALLILWFSFVLLEGDYHPLGSKTQLATYHVGLYAVGLLFASFLFHDLSDNPRGIHFLMIPATATEKLLTAILFGLVLFMIFYTAVFYAVDTLMVEIANSLSSAKKEVDNYGRPYVEKVVNIFTGAVPVQDDYDFGLLFLIFLALQTAFMLGSIYFPKYSFIKTAISILVIFLFFVFLIGQVLDAMMPEGTFHVYSFTYSLAHRLGGGKVALPEWVHDISVFCLRYGIPPVFILTTWFRLKEKEV